MANKPPEFKTSYFRTVIFTLIVVLSLYNATGKFFFFWVGLVAYLLSHRIQTYFWIRKQNLFADQALSMEQKQKTTDSPKQKKKDMLKHSTIFFFLVVGFTVLLHLSYSVKEIWIQGLIFSAFIFVFFIADEKVQYQLFLIKKRLFHE